MRTLTGAVPGVQKHLKISMKTIILIAIIIIPVFCQGINVEKIKNKDGSKSIKITTETYEVVVVDPASNPKENFCGARFCRGAWLKSLKLRNPDSEVLRTNSVFDWHPTWGLAQEFQPALALKKASEGKRKFLKIGVGEVVRINNNRFKDKILSLYPWKTKIERIDNSIQIIFQQDSPENSKYSYCLSQKMIFSDKAQIITQTSLENKGNNTIQVETYLHPFFVIQPNSEIIIDGKLSHKVKKMPNYKELEFPHACKQIRATGLINNAEIKIETSKTLSKLVFWKAKNTFAIEPFQPIKVLPQQRSECKFSIFFKVQRNNDEI